MRILSEIDFALSNFKCQCKDALLIVSEWSAVVISKSSELLLKGGAQYFLKFSEFRKLAELSERGEAKTAKTELLLMFKKA